MCKILLRLTGLGWVIWVPLVANAEVLRHISDETVPFIESQVLTPANNERRITYRVICAPGGEVLPDCERTVDDDDRSVNLTVPNLPPDAEDIAEERAKAVADSKPKSSQTKSKQKNGKTQNTRNKKTSIKKSTKKSTIKPASNKKAKDRK